ncbi:MAG: tRNA(5-methylaminomethyl-2-thiouridylate) methyltransferase [Desulfovibrio sp.]
MDMKYDALALFSGGLDSILAAKVVQDQGLRVLGLHYVTPFFGKPHKLDHWQRIYGLDLTSVDISAAFVRMLLNPAHGYGRLVNPCVDCKILMLSHARELLADYGARFLISGEVVGQRPMSQRRDTLNLIRKQADVSDVLLRPLCAQKLDPTPMEESGLVDRSRLLDMGGRGRKAQLHLARNVYALPEIPTPAGGCLLTEPESAGRFYHILKHDPAPDLTDFQLATLGRQFWAGAHWLSIGRHKDDNERIQELARPGDYLFDVDGFPSPLALGRPLPGQDWNRETVLDAAALMASYSPKAVRSGAPVGVAVRHGRGVDVVRVTPGRNTSLPWVEPDTVGLKEWKLECAEARADQTRG